MKKITKEEALKKLEANNYKLSEVLKQNNVSKINLIACGNSISSGFSMSHYTKPLLFRNEGIEKILSENSIDLKKYHFARAEDNNDEHIYSWLINNIKLGDICKLNRFDLKAMKATGVDESNIDELYPLLDDTTIKGLVENVKESNVIIYNGATGSFLDNVTRGGKHYFTEGVKRDCTSIEAFLKYIQEYNRYNCTNIQVYLCGAPSILKASDAFINTRLKKIAENYANVTYVENIPKKLLYKKENGGITPDTHYDEIEYLELNSKILETINENYSLKKMLIWIDREFYQLNNFYQLGYTSKEEIDVCINDILEGFIKRFKGDLKKLKNRDELLKQIKGYLISRKHYDFHYIGKDRIRNSVDEIVKIK